MRTLLMTMTVLGMLAGSNGFGLAEIADLPKPAGIELSARITELERKWRLGAGSKGLLAGEGLLSLSDSPGSKECGPLQQAWYHGDEAGRIAISSIPL